MKGQKIPLILCPLIIPFYRCYKYAMKKSRFIFGFTLVELMITIAIASILLAVAAPSFTSLVSANTAKNAADRLLDGLAYARSEAVTRSTDVIVCSKNSISNTCSGTSQWTDGWLIYIEGAGTIDLDGEVNGGGNADDLLLRVEDLGGFNLSDDATAIAATVTYNSVGEASTIEVSFLGANEDASSGRNVIVSAQGATSMDKSAVHLIKKI